MTYNTSSPGQIFMKFYDSEELIRRVTMVINLNYEENHCNGRYDFKCNKKKGKFSFSYFHQQSKTELVCDSKEKWTVKGFKAEEQLVR